MFDRFRGIRQALQRSREAVFEQITNILDLRPLDESVWEELEELLIQADVGVNTTMVLLKSVRNEADRQHARTAEDVKAILQAEMTAMLKGGPDLYLVPEGVTVVLVVGVNGTGKTTSIAKLARYLEDRGRRVMLAAADTFRAAAIDQICIWGERVGVPVIAHQPGSDPGAVVYDAMQAARSRGADTLIIDTAGRLHTKFNLMAELKKVQGVIKKLDPTAPHEVLLVMDATTGQNGLNQARSFSEAVGVTGIILAKLDGTARGGIAFPICYELGLPIKFIGTGEKMEDLAEFDPALFVEGLFK